ncbi:MAG TPA: DoxX family membrane protein [Steroidobacteraceae bacterium]|nr:DoxX family membrane protein [Steroidobacteraceae bacterium]
MNKDSVLYAFGAILLGAVGIWFHDFALQWQPVPKGLPAYGMLAYVSGLLLIAGGVAMLSRKGERLGALLLASFFGLWVVALHLPNAIAGWKHIGAWNAPAEFTFATMGGVALFSTGAGAMRGTLAKVARILAGASCIVFGLAHFNYLEFTASMVPAWIPPNQKFWAAVTGAGHLAAGLALVGGYRARLAATLEAAMMACFVVLLHIPLVVAAPSHINWVMLAVASTFTGAAWLVRKHAT